MEGGGKGKKGRKAFKSIVKSKTVEIIVEVVQLMFREYKFPLKKVLLGYSGEDSGS